MKQIRLTKGLFALVSPEDYDRLSQYKWTASHESRGTKWYAIRWVKRPDSGKRIKIRMHRDIKAMSIGSWDIPDNLVVDHINHNSLDNRRENLRLLTQRENMLASPGWKRAAR